MSDTELYDNLKHPFASKERAEFAVKSFLKEVEDLRISHGIGDAVVSALARADGAPNGIVCQTLALGEAATVAQICALLYRLHVQPQIDLADRLREIATKEQPTETDE
jgi:hypothetical protein